MIRGAGVSVAALSADELQLLYCTADAIIPSLAAMADAIRFIEKNPERAKASLGKVLALQDSASLQAACDASPRLHSRIPGRR